MDPFAGHQDIGTLAACNLAENFVELTNNCALLLIRFFDLNFLDAAIASFCDLDCEVHHQKELQDQLTEPKEPHNVQLRRFWELKVVYDVVTKTVSECAYEHGESHASNTVVISLRVQRI
jgi:hypothetical protein